MLSNALKFTEKGQVKLSAKVRDKSPRKMWVDLSVEDTGIGIKKEDQGKIFESFEQVYSDSSRKYNGTGLGLSIGLRLLDLMNSKLEVESEAGKGSRFFFSIEFDLISGKENFIIIKQDNTDIAGKRVW